MNVKIYGGARGQNKTDIRLLTRVIIKRGAQFLVGTIVFSDELRWSDSPYDAWWTRDMRDALKMAKKTGGDLWLFNPVAGQLREVRR